MSELQPIPMPQMGVSVEEGTVSVWHKQQGDAIEIEEVVCEVTTDKVDVEVAAPAAGVLAEIVAEEGETVAVGAPLAMLAPEGAAVTTAPATAPAAATRPPASVPAPPPPAAVVSADITTSPGPVDFAADALAAVPPREPGHPPASSPVARRIAAEHGIDLTALEGSGVNGRIRKTDVLAAVAAPAAPTPPAAAPGDLPAGYDDVPHRIVATSAVRRAIAEHMSRSRRTAAHMTTEVEVDMHRVAAVRAELNAVRVPDGLPKLSYLPFVARAACSALAEYPDLNATFEGERLIQWRQVNLGIAVDTDRGLMAPVIRGCEQLNVAAIGERIAELAARTRARTLIPDEMRAGTFTLSNPGSVGSVSAHAIINQPQVGILGTPAIVKRPWVVTGPDGEEAIAIRPIMLMALTFDHRAVDGAEATRCIVAIKDRLETWSVSDYS
jgi:pyruvate dehydrogenase E2 component (dihydrolipoamide acetyltransferase)